MIPYDTKNYRARDDAPMKISLLIMALIVITAILSWQHGVDKNIADEKLSKLEANKC